MWEKRRGVGIEQTDLLDEHDADGEGAGDIVLGAEGEGDAVCVCAYA